MWLLRGPLGSGKTTFVRAVLRSLGYTATVPSPTYVLRRDYVVRSGHRWNHVVHVDAYRVTSPLEDEVLDLLAAAADPRCLLLIEWPDKISTPLGVGQLNITFSHQKRGRKIVVT